MTGQTLQTALEYHQSGELQKAKAIYRRLLRKQPTNTEAMHLAGLVAYQTGELDEAAVLIGRAVRLAPGSIMHFNLATVLRALGREAEAMEQYRLSLRADPNLAEAQTLPEGLREELAAIDPGDAEGCIALGAMRYDKGLQDEAADCFRRALAIRPEHAEAYNRLGLVLHAQRKYNEAIDCFRRVIMLQPDHGDAWGNQGDVFFEWGELDGALRCYREQQALQPENETIRYMVDALSGGNAERSPAGYVEQMFDRMAGSFDRFLQQDLGYDIPAKMLALIAERLDPPPKSKRLLDLGCGTGLAGLAIAPLACQLVGVDLSGNMLEQARSRGIYHRLEQSDLLTMMQAEPEGAYDLVVATDVFVYLGKLDEVVAEMQRLLAPGGAAVFSVEAHRPSQGAGQEIQPPFRLENTGRYTHAPDYISRLAAAQGFGEPHVVETAIRRERGEPVPGYLVLLQRHGEPEA